MAQLQKQLMLQDLPAVTSSRRRLAARRRLAQVPFFDGSQTVLPPWQYVCMSASWALLQPCESMQECYLLGGTPTYSSPVPASPLNAEPLWDQCADALDIRTATGSGVWSFCKMPLAQENLLLPVPTGRL